MNQRHGIYFFCFVATGLTTNFFPEVVLLIGRGLSDEK